MADPIKPKQHLAEKRDRWWLVPAIADTSAPTVAEITAAGGIYATCYLLEDQGGVSKTVNRITLKRTLCDDSSNERLTTPSYSMSDIVGVLDPQAAESHDDKLLFEFLRGGFSGFAVREQNVLNDTTDLVTAGEFVDVVPVDIDDAWPDKSETGPAGFYTFSCGVAVTGTPVANVAVAASA